MNFNLPAFDALCARAADRAAQPYDEIEAWASDPTCPGGWDVIAVELLGVVPSVEMPGGEG